MSIDVTFEQYLSGKKIDSAAFRKAEPAVWKEWKQEFDQMHPNSFTVQKLNLINPVRRKYTLSSAPEAAPVSAPPPPSSPVVRPGKPVMRPKPKTD